MTFDDFKDRMVGQQAIIVGKGPSLDRVAMIKAELEKSVVLCCNQAVHAVEDLGLKTAVVFAVQQDCELEYACVPKLLTSGHFMSDSQYPSGDRRLGRMRVQESHYNPKAFLYSARHFCAAREVTAVAALKIARHMGIKSANFFAFDSWDQRHECEKPEMSDYAACLGPEQVKLNRDMGYPRHHTNGVSIRWNSGLLMESYGVLRIVGGVAKVEILK